MEFRLLKTEGSSDLVVVHDGKMYNADSTHPNWDRLVAGAIAADESIIRLFDLGTTAQEYFERLSDRVTVSGGVVYFDSDPVDGELTDQIVRFVEQDVEDWRPLVKFYENVMTNLDQHTRDQLYRWLQKQNIAITDNGTFIAYKGVYISNEGGEEKYRSVHHGRAIVDGKVHNGAIPNHLGAIVEMPRSEVTNNPGVGCAQGLHAGTWEYASQWGTSGKVLEVEINPADVVSVPTDCDSAKLRVCRYRVVNIVDAPRTEAVYKDWSRVDSGYEDDYTDDDVWGDGEGEEDYF